MLSRSTPLPPDQAWLRKFNAAIGDPDPKLQSQLAKSMQLTYRSGVGELIWVMTTCRPDLTYTSIKLSQSNSCLHEIHFHGLKHALKFLYNSKDDGLYFWRTSPHPELPVGPLPKVNSNRQDILVDTDHNLMLQLPMPMQTPTGLPALKHDILLVVSVSASQEVPLLTNTNSNQLSQVHQQKPNLWPLVTQEK
jgi:hypothetical protein